MRALLRVLVIGFAMVFTFFAAATWIGVRNARSITASATALVADQLVATRLLDEVEREQEALNAAFYRLSRTPEKVDRDRVLADLDETDQQIGQLVEQSRGGPEEAAWRGLHRAVLDFSSEARALLNETKIPEAGSRDLFFRHEQVTARVARLVDQSYARAVKTQQSVEQQSARLARESAMLVGGCLLVALLGAIATVRIAARVYLQMEAQAEELNRVSFRMLEVQEETARRFSHELHDELGGSLTAIKTNLHAMVGQAVSPAFLPRIEDCLKVVDSAISTVRELSQLLRPTILDDFGLDAGLRWLAERFQQRTRVIVDYQSSFTGRVADQTETHLFRIVQEALTNIARHAKASKVTIRLEAAGGSLRLAVSDNGVGIGTGKRGMGLTGIEGRARSIGGHCKVISQPGAGVTIEVWAPLSQPAAAEPTGEDRP